MDCIFCKIVTKEIPTKILYEDDDTVSFLDAFPVAKGHTLVIPKTHHAKIQDLSSLGPARLGPSSEGGTLQNKHPICCMHFEEQNE
mgnify:CR=1 FL=1